MYYGQYIDERLQDNTLSCQRCKEQLSNLPTISKFNLFLIFYVIFMITLYTFMFQWIVSYIILFYLIVE